MKVGLLSLGCARTLVDSEVALGSLKKEGYTPVKDVENCDIAIVNTCGFIEEAKIESIDAILKLCDLKKKGRISAVVVLGCLAQKSGDQIRDEIPEVDAVVGTDSYANLAAVLKPLRQNKKVFEVKGKPRYLLDENTPRVSLTPEHMAYVKISEGCINACSYCVIPTMKGAHRSRTIESITREISDISESRKISEINLIGQDTAAFGYDRGKKFELPDLIRAIDQQSLVPWVRLLYAHPGHFNESMIRALSDARSFCKYIDLPIEHSHDATLKRMNRGVTRQQMLEAIELIRKHMPSAAIRTTIIVGFPGETDEEFEDLMKFIEDVKFERLGAFIYSPEEGSRSINMPGAIENSLKKERYDRLMALQNTISAAHHQKFIGQTIRVLVDEKDSKEKGLYYARTEYDAPDVDGQVFLRTPNNLKIGDFVNAHIDDALEYDLIGTC